MPPAHRLGPMSSAQDQGATKRGLLALQGQLVLYGQDAASGGLVLLPGSHRLHDALVPPTAGGRDYVQFEADEPALAGCGDARLVCAWPGDLILWDSRTVHASAPADPRAPLPTEPDGRPRPARAVAFVCMVPAAPHLEARPSLPAERRELVSWACTCTHWPFEPRAIVSRGPPGADVPDVLTRPYMTEEARALVVGAPSAERRRWRTAAIAAAALAESVEPMQVE